MTQVTRYVHFFCGY